MMNQTLLSISTYKICYFFIPIFIILSPTFPAFLPDLLGFQILFVIEIFLVALSILKGVARPIWNSWMFIIFLYFLYSTVFSLIIDITRGIVSVSDFFEISKPFAFLLFYWYYRYSQADINEITNYTQKAISVIFLTLAVFSICAWFFPSIFSPIEFLLYKRSTVPILENKAIGSFSTTYHFAYCLLLPLTYSFISLMVYRRLWIILIFLLYFAVMLLTQSRSMYICSIVCLIASLFLPLLHNTLKKSLIVCSIFFIMVGMFLYLFFTFQDDISNNLAYAVEGFDSMYAGENNSVNTRESQIEWSLNNNSLILIGSGIGKNEMLLESFYALYYYRYGLIGVLLFLYMVLYSACKAFQIGKYEQQSNTKYAIFYYSLFVFFLTTPLAVVSSDHTGSPKIAFFVYGLMGLIHAKSESIKHLRFHK